MPAASPAGFAVTAMASGKFAVNHTRLSLAEVATWAKDEIALASWICCAGGAAPPAVAVKNKPAGAMSGRDAEELLCKFNMAVTYWTEFKEFGSEILTSA